MKHYIYHEYHSALSSSAIEITNLYELDPLFARYTVVATPSHSSFELIIKRH